MNSRADRLPAPRTLVPPLEVLGGGLRVVDAVGTLLFRSGSASDSLRVEGSTIVVSSREPRSDDAPPDDDGAWLFWPPRPASLLLWSPGADWRPLDGDATVVAAGRALIVDPAGGAAIVIERRDGLPLQIRSAAGIDPIQLRSSGETRATLLAEMAAAMAWLHAAGEKDAAVELARRGGSAARLDLRIENLAPGHFAVRWSRDAKANAEEQEEIAKLEVSRRNGSWLWLIGPSEATGEASATAAAALPSDFRRLVGQGAPIDGAGWRLWAPSGRGRVARRISAEDASASHGMAACLPSVAERRALALQSEEWLATRAERSPAAAPRTLRVAAVADGVKFRHETDGGERVVVAIGGDADMPTVGRRVATCESFELVTGDWPTGERLQLVLERTTCREDFAALLRLELDDEDLGPWRLGAGRGEGGTGSDVQLDYFAIPADLLAGRARCRITVHYVTAGDHVALRWRFLAEEEPAGSWLTDLDVAPDAARPEEHRSVDVASGRIGRRLGLIPGVAWSTTVPRGYARLIGRVASSHGAPNGSAAASLRVEIEPIADPRAPGALVGTSPSTLLMTRPGDEVDLALPATPIRLRLTANHLPLTLENPRLLRR